MQVRTKATHQQTRAYNQGLVLRTLYDRGPVSRADVARMTGLTRTTVSDVVAEFVAEGLVREVGRGPSSGGKAPILLQVVEDARLLIGLDLGEREFTAALVDLRGEIRRVERTPVEGRDGDAALEAVYRLVDTLVADNPGLLLGIGVGTPGLVDTDTGTIRWAVNLDWQDLPLGALLRQRYDLPTHVANDSRAAALGEYLFAGEGRSPNLIAIKVGQGIGAGIVLGGELFGGDSHGAGEIGHTTAVEGGAPCRCGRSGCLETVASSRAILEATGAASLDEVAGPTRRRRRTDPGGGRSRGPGARRRHRGADRRPQRQPDPPHRQRPDPRRHLARRGARRGTPPFARLAGRRHRDRARPPRRARRRARCDRAADDPRTRIGTPAMNGAE